MLGFIGGLIATAFKIMCTFGLVSIFVALIKNGKDTIRDLRDTVVMAIKLGTTKLQGWLFKKYKEQRRAPEQETTEADGHVS